MSRLNLIAYFETLPYVNWYQRMGDPTVAGWTITIAYFLVTVLCWQAGLKEKTINVNIQKPEGHVVWFGLSILFFVLVKRGTGIIIQITQKAE